MGAGLDVDVRSGTARHAGRRVGALALLVLLAASGCALVEGPGPGVVAIRPLTASDAIGRYDAARDASLRLVIAGLDEDVAGRPARAQASYQRAVGVDPTNPFAFLALARHHLEGGSPEQASAFLDQARALFESESGLGPEVDVWGIGLRAGIDRALGHHAEADARFETARAMAPGIWDDERLSAGELR